MVVKSSLCLSMRIGVRISAPAQKLGLGPCVLITLAVSPVVIRGSLGLAGCQSICQEDTLPARNKTESDRGGYPVLSFGPHTCAEARISSPTCVHAPYTHTTHTNKQQAIPLPPWGLHPSAERKTISMNSDYVLSSGILLCP